jgi:hypothetical protein
VRCPSGPFTVVASDDSPISWFAFRQPAEIGAGSAIAESLIQRSSLLGIVVGGLVLLGLASEIRLKRPVQP